MESAFFNVLMYVLLFIRGASQEYVTADVHYFSSSMNMDVYGTVRVHNKKGSEKILLEFEVKERDGNKKEKARLLLRFDEKKMFASGEGKTSGGKNNPPVEIPGTPDKMLEEAFKENNNGELPEDAGKITLADLNEELSVLRFPKWGPGAYLLLFKDKKTGLTPKIELHGLHEKGFVFYRFEVSNIDFSKIDKAVFEP